jgi:hypothetical protein
MGCKLAATRSRAPRAGTLVVFTALSASWASTSLRAQADPLRLKADAIAETQAPAGLIVLQGEDNARPWVQTEGLVWAGSRPYGSDTTADVLVLAMRLREPHGYGDLRVGRFVVATGAIRPVQIDGGSVLGRAPWGSTVEAFGGVPVVPSFGARAYDWIVGGRVAQSVASRVTAGASVVERRTHGEIADAEVGADLAAAPIRGIDVAARSAYDLTSPGVADAFVSAAARTKAWRFELFGTHRSPSRLLPATSLFSVLGDFPSEMGGMTVRWDAAPRLDLLASGAVQSVGGDLGGNAWVRALLRTDERGDGNLGLEVRRQDVSTAQWTGVRGVASQPLNRHLRFSTEIEVAVADEPRGRGVAWPWGLLAMAWRSGTGWEAAAAVEAAATAEHRFETNALFRISRTLEIP